jgi:hypothetical protein
VDQDPNFHFYADPDPTFHFDADQDSDPASHFDADPDFAPHQSDASLRPLTCTFQTVHGSILSFHASIVSNLGLPWLFF